MLELDELLGGFLEKGYQQLPPQEKSLFSQLLRESDVDLHQWLLTDSSSPDHYASLIESIRCC